MAIDASPTLDLSRRVYSTAPWIQPRGRQGIRRYARAAGLPIGLWSYGPWPERDRSGP